MPQVDYWDETDTDDDSCFDDYTYHERVERPKMSRLRRLAEDVRFKWNTVEMIVRDWRNRNKKFP